jgi:hypothetical protein
LAQYVTKLPDIRRSAYGAAQEGWNSDVRTRVFQASVGVIDHMKAILIGLLSYYPTRHFGLSPTRYVKWKVAGLFKWHLARYNFEGPNTAGNLADNFSAFAVMTDLETLITQTVNALSWTHGDINFEVWREEWKAAA